MSITYRSLASHQLKSHSSLIQALTHTERRVPRIEMNSQLCLFVYLDYTLFWSRGKSCKNYLQWFFDHLFTTWLNYIQLIFFDKFVDMSRLFYVESYWLMKEWIATAVYLKWMKNSVNYIENLLHSSIYWFSFLDSSRFIWESRSSFVTKIFSFDQVIFVFRCHFDLISSESHIHFRIHWFLDDLEN